VPGLDCPGEKTKFSDHRAAPVIVHANGDDVGIAADPVGRECGAGRRREVGALRIHGIAAAQAGPVALGFQTEHEKGPSKNFLIASLSSPNSLRRAAIDVVLPEIRQICCILNITLRL
jgi:hypothetical protein